MFIMLLPRGFCEPWFLRVEMFVCCRFADCIEVGMLPFAADPSSDLQMLLLNEIQGVMRYSAKTCSGVASMLEFQNHTQHELESFCT